MKIEVASVFVNDQSKAHAFYTENLGFETKLDIPQVVVGTAATPRVRALRAENGSRQGLRLAPAL